MNEISTQSLSTVGITNQISISYDDIPDSTNIRFINGNTITVDSGGWLTTHISAETITPDISRHSWTDDVATKHDLDCKADKEHVYGLEQRVLWLERTLYKLNDKLSELLTRVNISEDDLAELLGISNF